MGEHVLSDKRHTHYFSKSKWIAHGTDRKCFEIQPQNAILELCVLGCPLLSIYRFCYENKVSIVHDIEIPAKIGIGLLCNIAL